MSWHKERFTEKPGRIRFDCVACSRPMFFPASKAGKYQTCSEECGEATRRATRDARSRDCLTCGGTFVPRTTQIASGGGKYCSVACAEPTRAAGRTLQAAAKRGQDRRARYKYGAWIPARGPANPNWKGGREAYALRQQSKREQHRARRRAYLKANPAKVREWASKRRGLGRLPRGTVARIGGAQRWRCAICTGDIRREYHVDHIVPIARGGAHAPKNIQLLCVRCNLTKSAKDPIDFMQERGFLL